jgi:hypothetical protein
MGDVCIRKFERSPPSGGTVIAITSWENGYPTDPEGYPIFQNTRGVCAKIYGPSKEPIPSAFASAKALAREAAWKVTGSLKDDRTVDELMVERQNLFKSLAELKMRQYGSHPEGQERQQQGKRKEKGEKAAKKKERKEFKAQIKNLTREIKAKL